MKIDKETFLILIKTAERIWDFNKGLEKLLNTYMEESQLTKTFDDIIEYLSDKTEECLSGHLKHDIPTIYTFVFNHNWCKTSEDAYTIKFVYTENDALECRITNAEDLYDYLKRREACTKLYGYTKCKETYSN